MSNDNTQPPKESNYSGMITGAKGVTAFTFMIIVAYVAHAVQSGDWTAKEGGVTSINTGYVGCKRDDGYGESTTFRDRDYFASNGYKN